MSALRRVSGQGRPPSVTQAAEATPGRYTPTRCTGSVRVDCAKRCHAVQRHEC
jgi:hypothetical protein